jgi:hypothetical protein
MSNSLRYCCWVLVLAFSTTAWAQRGTIPKHLALAESLVANLDLDNTSYNHGEPKVSFVAPYQSHADCGGFIDSLLQSAYGYTPEQFKKWFDSHRPTAKRYHDAIVQQQGFTQIEHVQDTLPGDLLAVKYFSRTDNTGHVMLVAERPVRITTKGPMMPGAQQWAITVIDSSKSGHGPSDTRHRRGPDGKDHDGVGKGVLRIVTDADGRVLGFSWSTLASSEVKSPSDEELVIGRLKPGFNPE